MLAPPQSIFPDHYVWSGRIYNQPSLEQVGGGGEYYFIFFLTFYFFSLEKSEVKDAADKLTQVCWI